MKRYACAFLSLHFFFFYFFFVHGDDTSVMINLNKMLTSSNGKSTWNTHNSSNPCRWSGVTCTSQTSGNVTKLSLSGLGLTTSTTNTSSASAFFGFLCKLESLESLDLSSNSFAFIPTSTFSSSNCSWVSKLKSLNFSSNVLNASVGEFSSFPNLEVLDLSYNMLEGEVGSQLNGLGKLKSLNLSANMFDGEIPKEISQFKNLTTLDLNMNQFSGSIPDGIGELSKLQYLHLSSNNLTGRIPNEISKLQNLTFLDLSMNNLSGSIPDGIGELPKLQYLILSSNNLTGKIPSNLLSIRSLHWFAANQNHFTGAIPEGIATNLQFLDLSFNSLSGPIPSLLFSLPHLHTVDLSSNLLEGHIPENFPASLIRLRLGENKFNGSVPSSFQQMSNLTYLELDNNHLDGVIPPELGNCQNLTLLNLASNQLHGGLPKELGNLSNLVVMELQGNGLNGEIPGEFSKLTNLITLNLSKNSLDGPIPSSITNLPKLQNLNLAANGLTGSIPSNIGNLSALIELQLGNNKLSGTVPLMPTSLNSALNLSSNHLSGAIPSHLGGLSLLEILDLSNNNFTGEVPSSLTQMQSLTLLDISNNHLFGILPSFSRHVNVTYTGNSGLVVAAPPGPPPGKKKSKAWVTIVGIVSALIGVGLVAAVIFLVVSKRFYQVEDDGLQLEESPPQIVNGVYITSDSIHRSNIDFAKAIEVVGNPRNIMSKTRLSTYYKAVMPSGMRYSVKKLNWSEKIFQMGSNEKFGLELQVLGRLSNSNVMVPLAYVLTQDSAYLFYEHVHKGTIFDFLHNNSENALDWQSRYSIALGVAQGLTFLHGCTQPVLLLDLSTKSIRLKSMKEPQIGDIELCKVIDPSKSTGSLSTIAGSVGYIPPEYAYTMRVTAAANVYSFGVILLELLTGKPPVSQGIELAKWALSFSTRLNHGEQILDSRVCNASPAVQRQMLSVLKVAVSCVSLSPESRPKMRNVLRSLFNAR